MKKKSYGMKQKAVKFGMEYGHPFKAGKGISGNPKPIYKGRKK